MRARWDRKKLKTPSKMKELFCKILWYGNIYIRIATEVLDMPEISLFYGIRVTMYYQDELMQNWELSKDGLPLNRINPLI